jgi:phospho-N-acetylmuramoyl-pentapeptide-transferase
MLIYFFIALSLSVIIPLFLKNYVSNNVVKSHCNNTKLLKKNIPIMGGFIFLIPINIYLIYNGFYRLFIYGFISTLFGLIDDLNKIIYAKKGGGLNNRFKMGFLYINYLLFCLLFNNIPSIKDIVFYQAIYLGILFTDGVDGLLSILLTLTLFSIYFIHSFNNLLLIIFLSILPFIRINRFPAKIFMGDTGSHFLAAIVHYLLYNYENRLTLGSIYFIASLTSTLQKIAILCNRKILPIAPYHHTLETLGWTNNEIVGFYSILYILIISYLSL